MTEPLTELPALVDLASGSPVVVRAVIGAIGVVLLLWGARIYRPALLLTTFAAGAVGALALLLVGAEVVPALGGTPVLVIGAVVAGAALSGLSSLVHRLGLLAAGGIGGVAVAGAVAEVALGGVMPWWVALAGALAGALAMPLLFKSLLKVLTPAAGALCIAWAVGQPTHALLLLGLWLSGSVFQLAVGGRRRRDPEDD